MNANDNDQTQPASPPPKLSRVVKATGFVSFFTDMGSEIIYPLLPSFLLGLGASKTMIGLIEGLAEGFPAFVKLFSGALADRVKNRKWLVLIGYGLSTVTKPLIALATASGLVLFFRMLDRLGKGIRTAPRDAIVADNVDKSIRGYAFGFQRGMDHAGAMLGGLIAFTFLYLLGEHNLKLAIFLSIIPGALAVLTIFLFISDRPDRQPAATAKVINPFSGMRQFPASFFTYIIGASLFAMANSSDVFLLMQARALGIPLLIIPLLWSFLHMIKAGMSVWGGRLSDRVGRTPVLIIGWVLYAIVYLGFAFTTHAWASWPLFALYGVFSGMTEGAGRAVVADLVPEGARGRAFGLWGFVEGILLIGSSVLTGWLWDKTGSATVPLMLCGSLSLLAALYLAVWSMTVRRKVVA